MTQSEAVYHHPHGGCSLSPTWRLFSCDRHERCSQSPTGRISLISHMETVLTGTHMEAVPSAPTRRLFPSTHMEAVSQHPHGGCFPAPTWRLFSSTQIEAAPPINTSKCECELYISFPRSVHQTKTLQVSSIRDVDICLFHWWLPALLIVDVMIVWDFYKIHIITITDLHKSVHIRATTTFEPGIQCFHINGISLILKKLDENEFDFRQCFRS